MGLLGKHACIQLGGHIVRVVGERLSASACVPVPPTMVDALPPNVQALLGADPARHLDTEEIDDFISKADEVSRLIDGLRDGSVSPDELDRVEGERKRTAARKQAEKAEAEAAAVAKKKAPGADLSDEKRDELKKKVDEIMERRERRLAARERFDAYRKKRPQKGAGGEAGTDYGAWDMWTPSDDEDDMINSITPSGAGFAMMEKDINERHARMRASRQVAERRRVEGNVAYAAGQFSEALRCYDLGLESEKRNKALHANAAMAALKSSCFVQVGCCRAGTADVPCAHWRRPKGGHRLTPPLPPSAPRQAIEHCDSVINLAEFFHQNLSDPLVLKAYQRRAAAHQGLGHLSEAVSDLTKATELFPGEAEVRHTARWGRSRGWLPPVFPPAHPPLDLLPSAPNRSPWPPLPAPPFPLRPPSSSRRRARTWRRAAPRPPCRRWRPARTGTRHRTPPAWACFEGWRRLFLASGRPSRRRCVGG